MIPLSWREDYPGGARRVAFLGDIQVGAVIAGEKTAQWIAWLPNEHGSTAHVSWRYVKNEVQAKAALVAFIAGWLARAGILSLAERDRADAASLPLFSEPAK